MRGMALILALSLGCMGTNGAAVTKEVALAICRAFVTFAPLIPTGELTSQTPDAGERR